MVWICHCFVLFFLLDSFRKTKEAFGQINIVCNNAGIRDENELDAWEKIVDVNLVGKKYLMNMSCLKDC